MQYLTPQSRECRGCGQSYEAAHTSQAYCASCRSHCTASGCKEPIKSTRLCAKHLNRMRRHGDINHVGHSTRKPRESHKIQLECARCAKPFMVTPSSVGRKYCSATCSTYKAIPTFECAQCGKAAMRTKGGNGNFNYKQRYCSRECGYAAQRTGFLDKNGYRVITIGGKQVMEHRHVMELHLGIKLPAGSTIHHKNGLRTDNRVENLEYWDHRHGKGQRLDDKIKHAIDLLREFPDRAASFGVKLINTESQESTDFLVDEIKTFGSIANGLLGFGG